MIRTIVVCCVGLLAYGTAEAFAIKAWRVPEGWFSVVDWALMPGIGFVLQWNGTAPDRTLVTLVVTAAVTMPLNTWISVTILERSLLRVAPLAALEVALLVIAGSVFLGFAGMAAAALLRRWRA